jgi:hypothetical protein
VITYEIFAVAGITVFIWLNEIIDIPSLILGAQPTPLNWRESLFESVIIAILGIIAIRCTSRLLQRMKLLEGMLSICSSCKRIRDEDGRWHQMELFIRDRSEADFSHGICPDCAERLYPGYEGQHE